MHACTVTNNSVHLSCCGIQQVSFDIHINDFIEKQVHSPAINFSLPFVKSQLTMDMTDFSHDIAANIFDFMF